MISRLARKLRSLAARWPRRGPDRYEIVLYHFVSDDETNFTRTGHTVRLGAFREQLRYLKDRFRLVGFADACRGLSTLFPGEGPFASVSFDDGYRCVLEEAYPILEEMQVPATMFVNPAALGNRDLLWRDKVRYLIGHGLDREFVAWLEAGPTRERYDFSLLRRKSFYKWSKSPEALRDMSIQADVSRFLEERRIDAAGVARANRLFLDEDQIQPRRFLDFGNHTWSHPIMTLLDESQQAAEVRSCHEYLVARGLRPSGLSMPFSPFNEGTLTACRELGYKYVLTVFERSNPTSFAEGDAVRIFHRRMAPGDAATLRRGM